MNLLVFIFGFFFNGCLLMQQAFSKEVSTEDSAFQTTNQELQDLDKKGAGEQKKTTKTQWLEDDLSTEWNISEDLVFRDDLVKMDDSNKPRHISEVSQKGSEEPSPYDLVPMHDPQEAPLGKVFIPQKADLEETQVKPAAKVKSGLILEPEEESVEEVTEPYKLFTDPAWQSMDKGEEKADQETGTVSDVQGFKDESISSPFRFRFKDLNEKDTEQPKNEKSDDQDADSVDVIERMSRQKAKLSEKLTLEDAVNLAIKNNAQLGLAAMDLSAASEKTKGSKAYWEPELVVDASIEESRRKNTVEQSVRLLSDTFEEDNARYSMALEGILPLGTTYRIGYDMDELANSLTNRSSVVPFQSEYNGFAGVSVTQPLLKNFGTTYTRSNLINARLEEEIARQNLRKQRMQTVASTVLGYWDVWMHQKLTAVRYNSLKNARKLQSDNEKRRALGKMAEIEVDTARGGVVVRETRWLDAVNRYYEALETLADLLSVNLGEERTVLETPKLVMVGDHTLDVNSNLKSMWAHHPDLKVTGMEVEIGELRLKVLSNQSKPELNLVGNYGHNGLGADRGESNEDISEGDFDQWSVGLVFRMGLAGGQEMIHRKRKAEIELERSRLTLDYVEKELENRMRTVLKQVRLLRNKVGQQAEGVKIAQKVLNAEQKLLDAGKSKTARVLEVEEKLLMAMEEYLNVQLYYQKGLIEMRIANAQILEEFSLE